MTEGVCACCDVHICAGVEGVQRVSCVVCAYVFLSSACSICLCNC